MVWVAVLVRADDCGALFMHLRVTGHQLTVGLAVVLAGSRQPHITWQAAATSPARLCTPVRMVMDVVGSWDGQLRCNTSILMSTHTPLSIVTSVPSR